MFLDPDEYLLIMQTGDIGAKMSDDELRMLASVGVRTVYAHAAIRWELMQPEPTAPLDWSRVDEIVERINKAGLKMLLPFIYSIPPWKPDEFFFSREKVEIAYGIPSYTNPEVAEELDAMAKETIRRYSGDDCQVIYAIPANGEFPFHIWPRNGRIPFAMDTLVSWVVERQRVFEAQHNEVWTAYHPYCNPVYWRPVYDALFDEFPNSEHYGILFTYVQHHQPHFMPRIKENQERGITYFGGTEYIQGMRANVPRLVSDGVRMLTAPTHPYQEHRRIEPWMLDEIKWAIGQYV